MATAKKVMGPKQVSHKPTGGSPVRVRPNRYEQGAGSPGQKAGSMNMGPSSGRKESAMGGNGGQF